MNYFQKLYASKPLIIAFFALMAAFNAQASLQYKMQSGVLVSWYFVNGQDGYVRVHASTTLPADACGGFVFDGKTDLGQRFFYYFTTAKNKNMPLTVWYLGTDDGSCVGSAKDASLVDVVHIGFIY